MTNAGGRVFLVVDVDPIQRTAKRKWFAVHAKLISLVKTMNNATYSQASSVGTVSSNYLHIHRHRKTLLTVILQIWNSLLVVIVNHKIGQWELKNHELAYRSEKGA